MVQKIPRRHRACCKCGARFEAGQELTSVLSVAVSEEYVRMDFCQECWEGQAKDHSLQGVWRVSLPIPEEEEGETSHDDRRILDRLLDALDEPLRAYVLALYLARRGILQRVRHPAGGRPGLLLYEVKATGECLEIRQLSPDDLAQADLDSIVL